MAHTPDLTCEEILSSLSSMPENEMELSTTHADKGTMESNVHGRRPDCRI